MTNEAKILLGIGLATLVILIGGIFFMSATQGEPTKPVDAKTLVRADAHTKGPKEAKVTLVEFADFQCPACKAAQPIVTRTMQKYGDKVQFVFRHFPLPMHKHARIAAQAAEAAGDQGKFFEMYDMLFQGQADWETSDKPMDTFVVYAEKLELDTEKFKKTVEENAHNEKIQSDVNEGNSIGVNSTPTFFLNGEKLAGIPNESELFAKIDALLKN